MSGVCIHILCYRKSKEEYEMEQERKRTEEVSILPFEMSYADD